MIWVAAVVSWPSAVLPQSRALPDFEQILREQSSRIESIDCRFVQTRSVSVLAQDVKRAGRFRYLRPDNILLSFDDGDYIKMTAKFFEMKSGGRVNRTKTASNPMLKNMSAMLSGCMSGDVSKIAAGFDVEITPHAGGYIMRLVPAGGRGSSRMGSITLDFDGGDMSLSSLRMDEPSGDYTLYEFSDKKFNVAVDGNLFEEQR